MDDKEMEDDGRWLDDYNDGFADWISIWIMILVWNLLIVMVICTHHACKFLDRLCCDKGLSTNNHTTAPNGRRRHGNENTEEDTHSVATTVQDEQDFEDCIKVDTTAAPHERTNDTDNDTNVVEDQR